MMLTLAVPAAAQTAGTAGTSEAATAADAPPPFKASPEMAIELRHAQWFDGQKMQRGTLYIEDGVFVAQRPRKVHRLMELREQYLVPPLADAHNHNLQSAWGLDKFGQDYLRDGVFYAAMLCADPVTVAPVRALVDQSEAPDLLFATACITSSDGQPLAMLQSGQPPMSREEIVDKAVLVMDTPEQVAQKWPLVAGRQADLVKVILAYHEQPELRQRPEWQGRLGVTADVLNEVTRRAHADGQRVVAHVESVADFEAAVRAGVDFIAELPGTFPHQGEAPESHLISGEVAVLAAQKKIGVITATAASRLFNPSPELLARIESTQKTNLERLHEAGVRLLVGSDLFPGNGADELRHLRALGALDTATVLRMATQDTPRALFPNRRLGCFEPGCEASFLVVGADPLESPDTLNQPLLRIKQGRVLTQLDTVAATAGSAETLPAGRKAAGSAKKSDKKSAKQAKGKSAKKASSKAGAGKPASKR